MAIRISSHNHQSLVSTATFTDDMHLQERRWFAVRTSSRHEKMAAKEMVTLGIECYLPLRERVCQYASKQVRRELPLLNGYLFVFIRQEEEARVSRAHYVSSFVRIGRERFQVTAQEIQWLRTLSTDRTLNWENIEDAIEFTEGVPVEIIKGPLTGIRGHFVRKKNKKTFLISLGGLGACLSTCEIDPACLVTLEGETLATVEQTVADEITAC